MIYTCTLNPSIDYFVTVDRVNLGETNRVKKDSKEPGGKGINVSRVLSRLGVDNKALGFVGGFTGDYIKSTLNEENINTEFIEVEGETRINIKLRANEETEINGQGPSISEKEIEALWSKIENIKAGDTLVLAGSIPNSMSTKFYKEVAEKLSNKGVNVVVDATKDQLLEVLPYKPFLIKPNHHELGEYFNVSINTVEETVPYGKKLLHMGAQIVIVSMGAKGTILFTEDEISFANVPEGTLVNSVGAGDSVVGGFLASYSKGKEIPEAFRYGAAAGSATAYSEGFCTPELIEELLQKIHVTTL